MRTIKDIVNELDLPDTFVRKCIKEIEMDKYIESGKHNKFYINDQGYQIFIEIAKKYKEDIPFPEIKKYFDIPTESEELNNTDQKIIELYERLDKAKDLTHENELEKMQLKHELFIASKELKLLPTSYNMKRISEIVLLLEEKTKPQLLAGSDVRKLWKELKQLLFFSTERKE